MMSKIYKTLVGFVLDIGFLDLLCVTLSAENIDIARKKRLRPK